MFWLAWIHAYKMLLWTNRDHSSRHTFNYDLIKSPKPSGQVSSVWCIPPVPRREKLHGHHPTQKPLRLACRTLLACIHTGDLVFDPFAGFGTTLVVAEAMGRVAFGIEVDAQRAEFIRSRLRHPHQLIHGDARRLAAYNLPAFDFSMTSPPYMNRHDVEDPFTNYTTTGGGYGAYLRDLRAIYAHLAPRLKDEARDVVEVANLKGGAGVTTLAWDVAVAISEVLRFDGEVVVGWDHYGYGYDHSYCLVFTRPSLA